MIEFSGELSKDSKNFLKRQNIIKMCLGNLILSIISIIVIFILVSSFGKIHLLWLMPILLCNILAITSITDKSLKDILPKKLIFDFKSGFIIKKSDFCEDYRKFSQIKIIYDYGKFYYFIFYFPNKNLLYLCQKDLLVQGDLNEFETYFKDKIVKRLM